MSNELQKIAIKWGTDKCNPVDFPEDGNAIACYHEMFKDRRNDVRKVLEIGIGKPSTIGEAVKSWNGAYTLGGSLFTWEEYFPKATVYALDVDPNTLVNEARVYSYLCDQGSEESLRGVIPQLGGNFDLIIDDGSHIQDHQLLTLKMLFPLLNSNGIYVCEDIVDPFSMVDALNILGWKFNWKQFIARNGQVGGNWMILKAEENPGR